MNINLLKINVNPSYNLFYETLTTHSFMPLITLPTRLSDTCDTLIDNIFANNSDQHHTNCILTRVVSDHQMTCCLLSKNTIEKTTNLLIEVETINQHTLENIYSKLYHNGEATVNENCEIFINILLEAKNKHIPKIMRKNNKRKDKKEKWMTSELLNQINLKNGMYVEWKSQSTSIDIYNSRKIIFKTFERIVNKNIDTTKKILPRHI